MRASGSRMVRATRPVMRVRSSAAALRLKVRTRICSGSMPASIRAATASTIVVVLPVPGPASTSSGPAGMVDDGLLGGVEPRSGDARRLAGDEPVDRRRFVPPLCHPSMEARPADSSGTAGAGGRRASGQMSTDCPQLGLLHQVRRGRQPAGDLEQRPRRLVVQGRRRRDEPGLGHRPARDGVHALVVGRNRPELKAMRANWSARGSRTRAGNTAQSGQPTAARIDPAVAHRHALGGEQLQLPTRTGSAAEPSARTTRYQGTAPPPEDSARATRRGPTPTSRPIAP